MARENGYSPQKNTCSGDFLHENENKKSRYILERLEKSL
jgi:hypothetical protein